jgi:hypothetical protein
VGLQPIDVADLADLEPGRQGRGGALDRVPGHAGHPRLIGDRDEPQLFHERDEAIVAAGPKVDDERARTLAHRRDPSGDRRRPGGLAIDDDLVEEHERQARGGDHDAIGPPDARAGDVRAERGHRHDHVLVLEVGELGIVHARNRSIVLALERR